MHSETMSTTLKQQVQGFILTTTVFQKINLLTNLVVGREVGQRVDREASLEELGVDPVVEAHPLVDLASVEVLAVPLAQEGAEVG